MRNSDTSFDVHVNGSIKSVTGVHSVCGADYYDWTRMMNLLKCRSIGGYRLWSVWVESTSKDVECTSGILNRRWRFKFVERYNREATAIYF